MDRNSIFARVASGFAVKAAAIVLALILAHSVYVELASVAARINGVLG